MVGKHLTPQKTRDQTKTEEGSLSSEEREVLQEDCDNAEKRPKVEGLLQHNLVNIHLYLLQTV